MTNQDARIIDLLHAWQALDELSRAQSSTLEKTNNARDSAWCEFLFAARQKQAETVLR